MKLLIDGDILLYKAASRVEKIFDWGDDLWSIAADLREAQGLVTCALAEIESDLGSEETVFCISDSKNFRKDIYPEYKGNRNNRKPLCYAALRDWAMKALPSVCWPKLEADDVMGIMATGPFEGDSIIVTIDKDLKCIPGRHYNPDKKGVVTTVDPQEAYEFHLIQAIAGDSTDNIKGVPGMGMVKAERLLKKHGFTWQTVLDAYGDSDQGREDALLNARLTKILTDREWDFAKQEVIMWTPTKELSC